MLINLENNEKIAITVIKKPGRGDLYEYYLEDTKIGVLDTDVMEDNILMLQNTLDNELINQIKDSINKLPREEIEREGQLSSEIDTYMREFGKRKEKVKSISVAKIDCEDRFEEKNDKNANRGKNEKEDKTSSTEEDITIKQSVDLY